MPCGVGSEPARRRSLRLSQSQRCSYAAVQTLQPEDRYGRLFAGYAGVFLIGALLWGWGIDGKAPDRFDWLGAGVVLVGVVIVLWGRQLFA
jgi:drug/metabolite transporter superfamily protein YnfA